MNGRFTIVDGSRLTARVSVACVADHLSPHRQVWSIYRQINSQHKCATVLIFLFCQFILTLGWQHLKHCQVECQWVSGRGCQVFGSVCLCACVSVCISKNQASHRHRSTALRASGHRGASMVPREVLSPHTDTIYPTAALLWSKCSEYKWNWPAEKSATSHSKMSNRTVMSQGERHQAKANEKQTEEPLGADAVFPSHS